jgi:protein phosphatase methylesterase 1
LCGIDLRGHGKTAAAQHKGMSRDQLAMDVREVIRQALANVYHVAPHTKIYLIGHSLGGAIVAALSRDEAMRDQVAGLVMVDIVEDTALFGLRHMNAFLDKRPKSFADVGDAAKWYTTEGGMHTLTGATRSVGRTLTEQPDGSLAWRTDLRATSGDWEGWFTGMNGLFVGSSAPKMLLLANTDRLDKGLTLAQMQGKFQLEVVREAGHHVQEDQPAAVAEKLVKFILRVDKLTRSLPSAPKVSGAPASPQHTLPT